MRKYSKGNEIKNKIAGIQVTHEKALKKPTVNETHKRSTLLIQLPIHGALQDLSQKQGRGFKTRFINQMLAIGLQEYGYDVEYIIED